MTKPEIAIAEGASNEQLARSNRPGRSSHLRRLQTSGGKRGRRPARVDRNAKLERSRQSARECRARKKQKYQLLEETVTEKEKQICALREKLEQYKNFCEIMDNGEITDEVITTLRKDDAEAAEEEEEDSPRGSGEGLSHQAFGGVDSSSDDDFD